MPFSRDRPADALSELTDAHARSAGDVLEALDVDSSLGLDHAEAARRLERHGPNEVTAKSGPGALKRFLFQFHQPLIYILLVAAGVTLILEEFVDSGVIFGVVVLNAIVGYIQESRALDALAALSRTMATGATVIREGSRHSIPAADVVPGDLVVIQSGDRVPADLRLVRVRELQVDESPFTGESVPVKKGIAPVESGSPLGDQASMAFASTLVTYGQAVGVVIATGGRTEVGHISELIESAEEIATPLTRRIASFSRILLVAILILAGVTFMVGLGHGEGPAGMFLASVALAVAAIPEGLPAAITITLAIGVNRMASRNAIIRKLPAVETLGSTTVICSDKTGTLTENQMTVRMIWAGFASYEAHGSGYEASGSIEPLHGAPANNAARDRCLLAGVLCNDSSIVEVEGRWAARGDPTEAALIVSARKGGWRQEDAEDHYPRVDTLPFESLRQYMASLHTGIDPDYNTALVKGAAEVVVQRCNAMLDPSGNRVAFDASLVLEQVQQMASEGLRVLAFAQRELPPYHEGIGHDDVAEGFVFLGLQGMIDPPRQEAIEAVRACRRAGITVKMITGDHAVTAEAIARQIGIVEQPGVGRHGTAISGRDLESLSDADLPEVAEDVHVFARVPPEGKLRLVRALQSRGHIVAMTGDGVNDGPALRQADIGIAMGITGTEVAKDASDMVLTDDNFASIRAAVEEGRGVFDNLTKFLVYILPTNVGQGLVILFAILIGTTLPIIPVQVLWVNMVTAVLLGLMLAFEPGERDIMLRPPRDPASPIINRALVLRMLIVSAILVGGAFGLFRWAIVAGASVEEARTVAVNLFMFVQLFYLLNCRSMTRSLVDIGPLSNRWILVGGGTTVLLQLAFTYTPLMQALFHSEAIEARYWAAILGFGLLAYLVVEAEKVLRLRFGAPAR